MRQGATSLVIVLWLSMLSLTVCAEQVPLATFHYPPVMDSSNPDGGLMGDIVRAAFQEVDIEPEIAYYPAKRLLLEYIGAKEYLACIGPIVLVDRQPKEKKRQVIQIPPLVDILMVFAYYKPTHGKKPVTYERLADLKGFTVGTILGSNTIPLLQDAGMVVKETLLKSQIKLLKANRIDYAVVGFLTGLDLVKTIFPGQEIDFAFIRKPVMELPTSIYFNKRFPRSSEYLAKFKRGLNAIIESGHYIRILENYYGKGKIPFEYKPLFHTFGIQYSF